VKGLRIVLRQTAIEDLDGIWLYTFKAWSREQADRYHDLIYKEIGFLSRKPGSGKDLGHIREGYKSSKVKSHFIFYKYTSLEIEIIRILHENMDIPNRLND
jgi:toxin ParE1/3/4